MVIIDHDSYAHPIPKNHRFPMQKYPLLSGQLKLEGFEDDALWGSPNAMSTDCILTCHTEAYWRNLQEGSWTRNEERRSGFTWSPELIRREAIIMQGTWECAQSAAQGGIGLNIAGGTHHAYSNRAEGFCLLNDMALSANLLISLVDVNRVLVVDLDVHQGNGTASITEDDPRIFTFSMHGASNFPFHKEKSSLDIALPDATEDAPYLSLLDHHLTRTLNEFQPDVVLYQCGVDVLESDKLGKLSLSMEGCQKRDQLVLQSCRERNIGVACAMGGGYSEDVRRIVEAHMQTFRVARDLWC